MVNTRRNTRASDDESETSAPVAVTEAITTAGISALDDPSTDISTAMAEKLAPDDVVAVPSKQKSDAKKSVPKSSTDGCKYATIDSVNELKDMLSNISKMVADTNRTPNASKSKACCSAKLHLDTACAAQVQPPAQAEVDWADADPEEVVHSYDKYPPHIAYKVYDMGLKEVRCKRVGDASFFTAKRAWDRLVQDFPVADSVKRRLLPLAFDGDARTVFEQVANTTLEANVTKLWELLQQRLCNEAHLAALQDRVYDMRWNERRESFTEFAQRLRSAALALPEGVPEDILLNRLRAGVPVRMRDQANMISGSFDVVVSKLGRLSSASSAPTNTREMVREIGENPKSTPSSTDRVVLPESSNPWAHARCHYCGEMGHISRVCDKKRNDRVRQGKAMGGQPALQGQAPGYKGL